MTRVIVHAGFYKTGTTSLQHFLAINRTALAPYLAYYGKADFMQAGARARIYAQRPFIWRRLAFKHAFRRFLNTIPNAPVIVLSRESFSGAMPGHRNIVGRTISTQHATATTLAREIIRALQVRFGPGTDVEFLYTTRDREDWMRSVYGHLLRSIHLATDYTKFRDGFANLPGPQADAHQIATSIAPIPVHTARLEDYADHREGPAAAVLDILRIPEHVRKLLKPASAKNLGQPDQVQSEFLHLNRGNRNKQDLKAIKDGMLRELDGRPG